MLRPKSNRCGCIRFRRLKSLWTFVAGCVLTIPDSSIEQELRDHISLLIYPILHSVVCCDVVTIKPFRFRFVENRVRQAGVEGVTLLFGFFELGSKAGVK